MSTATQLPALEGARPDPHTVARRPMARPGGGVVFARCRVEPSPPLPLFHSSGRLDVDVLQRIFEAAAAAAEGRRYPGPDAADLSPRFFGSVSLDLDLTSPFLADPVDDAAIARFAEALSSDRRARRVIEDRVYRELARLLGAETPAEFELEFRVQPLGLGLRLIVDVEGPLATLAAP